MSRRPSLVQSLLDLLRAGNLKGFLARAEKTEPADLGDVLASLDEEERLQVVQALPPKVSGAAIFEMPDETQMGETIELIASVSPEAAGEIV